MAEKNIAQDFHFSQFYHIPVALNPALTGLMNGNMRWIMNYRDQWPEIQNHYKTLASSLEFTTANLSNNVYCGLGTLFVSEYAGDFKYGTNQFLLSSSLNLNLNGPTHDPVLKNHIFSIGLQGGIIFQSMNLENLNLQNTDVDPNDVVLIKSRKILPDISLGFLYDRSTLSKDEQNDFIIGMSVYHINKPKNSFSYNSTSGMLIRWVLHSSLQFKVSKRYFLIPSVLFMQQGISKQINAGSFLKIKFDEDIKKDASFYIGAWWRIEDAWMVAIKFLFDNMIISYSYDINYSELNVLTKNIGGHEITLIFMSPRLHKNKKNLRQDCPSFQF